MCSRNQGELLLKGNQEPIFYSNFKRNIIYKIEKSTGLQNFEYYYSKKNIQINSKKASTCALQMNKSMANMNPDGHIIQVKVVKQHYSSRECK